MKQTQRGVDRRELLTGLTAAGGLLATGARPGLAQGAAAGSADSEPPILVLVELFGGNDGLSTLVPYTDDRYHALRPSLAIPTESVLPINDEVGFHPKLSNLRETFEAGELAVVRGIGYPQPVYSHFKSLEIWHTAHHEGRSAGDGWVARLRAEAFGQEERPELMVHIGGNQPYALQSPDHGVLSFEAPERYLWAGDERAEASYRGASNVERGTDTQSRDEVLERLYRTLHHSQRTSESILSAAHKYVPNAEYPDTAFGRSLRTIAALIEARVGTRVFSTNLTGFDTHAKQSYVLPKLLNEVDQTLAAFRADLKGRSTAPNVVVAVISEFGRRAAENHSGGTDHGAAGLAFLMGDRVKGGLYGGQPSLEELDEDGNLVYQLDFRSLYATLIEDWFKTSHTKVLGAEYPRLPVFKV